MLLNTDKPTPAYFYVHIPKTAGTTLKNILFQEFGEKESFNIVNMERFRQKVHRREIDPSELKIMTGHFKFGAIKNFIPRPVAHMTTLRSPVDRSLSYYYYIKRRSDHGLHYQANRMSPLEFIKRYDRNNQARHILGKDPSYPNALEDAKKVLMNYYALTGTSEKFDIFLFFLSKILDIKDLSSYEICNVTNNRASVDELDEDTIQGIREVNKVDIGLYNWVNEQIDNELNSLPTELRAELDQFLSGIAKRKEREVSEQNKLYNRNI